MGQTEKFSVLLKKMFSEWKWLFRYIKKYRLITVAYVVIGILSAVMSLCVSVASKYLIDAVVDMQTEKLVPFGVTVIALAVFQHVFQALSSWLISIVSTKANNEIRSQIYSSIISAEWKNISKTEKGAQ